MGNEDYPNIGGSVFWILLILISFIGNVFLAIWAFHANSVKGVVIAFIFLSMTIAGVVLSKFEILDSGTWATNCLSAVAGFWIWVFISSREQSALSILSISDNSLFASISGELPQLTQFSFNSFIIPISEELFWMVGIPFSMITILNLLGKKVPVFKNIFIQLGIITIVTGLTFAFFHVGKLFLAFLIAAFVFRMILVWAVIGDQELNWLKPIKLLPAFAVGAHIGNNWGSYGLTQGFKVLWTNPYVGLIIIAILLIILLTGINQISKTLIDLKQKYVG